MATEQIEALADPPRGYVSGRALASVMAAQRPAPLLTLAFAVLITWLLGDQMQRPRLIIWWALAVAGAVVTGLALWRYYRRPTEGQRPALALLSLGMALSGALFGLFPWLSIHDSVDTEFLLAFVPAVAGAVGCIVCAGRRDLYLWFLAPLIGLGATTLMASPNRTTHALGLVACFYGPALLVLHASVSATHVSAICLQWRTERLLDELAGDRAELTGLNQQLASTNQMLAHQAAHDPLTGLFNRRGTMDALQDTFASTDGPLSLLFCDLDRFKAVNDALGHRGGDRFISIVADRLARSLEPGSFAGRMGGDEFVVVLPDHDMGAAATVADRLVRVLAQPVYAEGREMPSSVSIGLATGPQHGSTSTELLRNANAALFHAKARGKNRVELFDGGMFEDRMNRLEREQELRRALDGGDIVAFFQPELDATSGAVVGAELLARWLRRDGRVAPAHEFMPVAINAGLVERVTERVLADARPHIRRLTSLGLPDGFRFRINLTSPNTDWGGAEGRGPLTLDGIDASMLTLDVSESAITPDLVSASSVLADFRRHGGRVCLDDFADGVSSLRMLRAIPLDEVRVDRMSIDAITAHPHDRAIVRSIIALVRELGLEATADGVETGAQADALIALGCVRHQGHLYAPAIAATAFEDYLVTRMADGFAWSADTRTPWEDRPSSR